MFPPNPLLKLDLAGKFALPIVAATHHSPPKRLIGSESDKRAANYFLNSLLVGQLGQPFPQIGRSIFERLGH
jgi:hypothetical protein